MSVRTQIITDFSEWRALRDQWRSLLSRCPAATPFQTPEWLLTWWEFFGSGQLLVFAFWKRDELAGLAPLFVLPWNDRRQVTLVGSGLSDYLDLPVERSCAPECFEALIHRLQAMESDWDLCDWQDLGPDSPLRESAAMKDTNHVWMEDAICSRLALPESDSAFEETLSHGLRRNLRRYAKHLEERGPLTWKVNDSSDAGLIGDLLQFHRERRLERWEAPFSSCTEEFLQAVCAQFARAGALRIFELRAGETLAAGIIGFAMRGWIFGYLISFDSKYEKFSPGILLLRFAIGWAIREKMRSFDFLRGEEAYKFAFGAEACANLRLKVYSRC